VPLDQSSGEVLLILFVALLVLGGELPVLARRLGTAIADFKRGRRDR
jgi:Sec-independent protein translocase protein TatA